MKCRKCGWPVTEQDKRCPNCGHDMQSLFRLKAAVLPSTLRRRLALTESNSGRLVGVVLGVLAIFLVWGGVFVREGETFLIVRSMNWNALDLMQSSDLIIALGTILFLGGTLASILESRASVVQIVSLVMLAFSLHNHMQSSLPEYAASDPTYMIYSSFGIGYFLAWFSALIVLSSNVLERRDAKAKAGKASLPASENERLNPRHWVGRWR